MASALFSALSTGSVALVARAVGAADMETANRMARHSVIVGLAVGLLATALALLLAEPAVALMEPSRHRSNRAPPTCASPAWHSLCRR